MCGYACLIAPAVQPLTVAPADELYFVAAYRRVERGDFRPMMRMMFAGDCAVPARLRFGENIVEQGSPAEATSIRYKTERVFYKLCCVQMFKAKCA